ncbi:MAG: glutamate synthase subunit beta [Candidatus Omnitrophica bacterium]|nr:glutamate synthase subunit beta [Candidatus Omnitrophota bacterium]
MGDEKGFLKKKREIAGYRPLEERIRDYREVEKMLPKERVQEQGSRCMDCGVPFCHYACPVGNVIPDWNDLMFRGQWAKAVEVLQASNNFPEFTGRICPALCEAACVVGIADDPVTIRHNEIAIIEWGFENNVIKPFMPKHKTGKRVAVVGSGPAGMSASQQLVRAGHDVILFEADDKAGGILRYGIPDFKLEKWVIDRRLELMKKEGLKIETNTCVGRNYPIQKLLNEFDAVCLTMGAREPRDLKVEGRGLGGIHFAMDYLIQNNRRVGGAKIQENELIDAKGKDVVIIGGGDTGADCVGTANRQGARSVTQLEVLPEPPLCRTKDMPWPTYPKLLKTSSSHEEGCTRKWNVATKKFTGAGNRVKEIHIIDVEFVSAAGGRAEMREVPGTEAVLKADLVILAMGFLHPVHQGLVKKLGLNLTAQGNIYVENNFMTSTAKVFAAGDASRGATLAVWAMYEGRSAAREIDRFLMGSTNLP